MIDPEQAEDEAFPRRVSMTWGEVCDVEVRAGCRVTRIQKNIPKSLGAPTPVFVSFNVGGVSATARLPVWSSAVPPRQKTHV